MNLTTTVTDNIGELLVKIIEFTRVREEVLSDNINDVHVEGFEPRDLADEEFAEALAGAVGEHIQFKRLILRDTDNVKFGVNGCFEVRAVVDESARLLLDRDKEEYLKHQTHKLAENSLNRRVASELLRQKGGVESNFA
jgi:flagellar basal body rod protein FlgB